MKNFGKLCFDKKTISRLNEEQLSSVKGGSNELMNAEKNKCKSTSTTKVCSTTSTTSID
ncbi:class I lanthipeptide [Myroides sp. DF42-4-2]|uniref:class I lanthipeptide n=1 Tax=Myroides sp. DF42-4-2 TaxID=2746726 RepID=UPI002575AD2E|nr:class I lanthipeptide [Myroides sp. DF42-4-2]MDM1408648.1 rSAM-modified peptide [Myroides sp. DF42-4-2]